MAYLTKTKSAAAKDACPWCGETAGVRRRQLTERVSIAIGCDPCLAQHAPFLLLSGVPTMVATDDLVNLATALSSESSG